MRTLGCSNPQKCCLAALRTLDSLYPKWDPHLPTPLPSTSPPSEEPQPSDQIDSPAAPAVPFNPTITTSGSLANGFHIFASPEIMSRCPAWCLPRPNPPSAPICAYIAESSSGLGSEEAVTGSGIWFTPDDPWNTSLHLPPSLLHPHSGELTAILYAIRLSPKDADLSIIGSSPASIDAITKHLPHWEDHN